MNKNIEEEWNFIVSKKNQKNKNCEISKMRNKNDYNPELFCRYYLLQHNKQMIFLKIYGKVDFSS